MNRGERLVALLSGLAEATTAGTADWRRTDDKTVFVLVLDSATITVRFPEAAGYSVATYLAGGPSIEVTNAQGALVDGYESNGPAGLATATNNLLPPSERVTSNQDVVIRKHLASIRRVLVVDNEQATATTTQILDELNKSRRSA